METDKILCPWCGAEMVRDGEALVRSDEVAVWMRCISCGASSPLIKGPQTLNLEKLYDMAHAAALRRYTPPLTPMTLGEAYEADHCYLEHNIKGMSSPEVVMLGMMGTNAQNRSRVEVIEFGEDSEYCIKYDCADYGKTWRCWERKPTDEERSAAEWET